MEEKTYKTGMGVIHYWQAAARPGAAWLVFLPGLTADHRLFDKQAEALGARFGCLVWDAPAHGASRPFTLAFTMDDLTGWLHGILEREGISRPVLVGQSMGGCVAQAYLEDGMTTVGAEAHIRHLAPTPVGMKVTATATLREIERRKMWFDIEVHDEKGKCGEGSHLRIMVPQKDRSGT